MNKLNYISLLLLLSLISCKKKETPLPDTASPVVQTTPPKRIDTIKPLSYLPAYPGSYWKYSNSVTFTTSANYVKDAYTVSSVTGVYRSDTFYVTHYNGTRVWGYRAHDEGEIETYGDPTQPFVRIISDSLPVGETWTTGYKAHELHWAKILAKDTTITIAGKNYYPTIVLSYSWSYNNGTVFTTSRSYYTKDIGLVKSESLSDSGTVTGETHLVDYFINK